MLFFTGELMQGLFLSFFSSFADYSVSKDPWRRRRCASVKGCRYHTLWFPKLFTVNTLCGGVYRFSGENGMIESSLSPVSMLVGRMHERPRGNLVNETKTFFIPGRYHCDQQARMLVTRQSACLIIPRCSVTAAGRV
ncbi:hypothetical protein F4778DRAFT_723718 [Xylariomycetidae sp. FL2044]|nr:hypothetical protein F4778DRAFT_723718 [Xylariomycetidae sp. FL2044]